MLHGWINKMNELFDWNAYTDNGRIAVDFSERCGLIIIKVLDDVDYIDVNKTDLNEYGLMCAVFDKVREMYDKR